MNNSSDYIVNHITKVNVIPLSDIGCEYLNGEITYNECIEKMCKTMDEAIHNGIKELQEEVKLL